MGTSSSKSKSKSSSSSSRQVVVVSRPPPPPSSSRSVVVSRPPPAPQRQVAQVSSSGAEGLSGGQSIRIADDSGNSLRVSRRRQIVVIALDKSGSMAGSRIKSAVEGVKQVLDGLTSSDLVAILTFNDSVDDFTGGITEATPENVRNIKTKLDRIYCTNQTALYDAVLGSTAIVLKVSEKLKEVREMTRMLDQLGQAAGLTEDLDVDLGHAWLVVISDGEDNKSKHEFEECAVLLGLLGQCDLDYNVLWLGVQLSGEAEQKIRILDALCGENSEFCNVNSSDIGAKFQEIAIKIKSSVGSSGSRGSRPSLALTDGPSRAWEGSIQNGSHVVATRRIDGKVQIGEVGTAIALEGPGRYRVRFYRAGEDCVVTCTSSEIRLDPTADAVRPGARVRVKRGVQPKGDWGPVVKPSFTGLVRKVQQNGAVIVDFGEGAHGWNGHIGELEPVGEASAGHLSGPFQIGNLVQVPDYVVEPSKKWGNVKHGDMGYVTEKRRDGIMVINFPGVPNWVCVPQDIEVVPVKDKIRPGKSVRVSKSDGEPKFGWGPVTKDSIGIVRGVEPDASVVQVDFPEVRGWKCLLSEIDLCDSVVELD